MGFPGGSEVKASACNAGDLGSIPALGRSPGEGNGNPLRILAWRIPRREKSSELQSMGSQKVRHDESNLAHTHSLFASLPQPEEVKITTVVLVRLLPSHCPPVSPHFTIKGARASLVSGAEVKEITHTHLNSKLPTEVGPS